MTPPSAQVTARPRRAPQALGPREPPSSCPARSPVLVPAASRRPATLQHRTLLARRPPRAHDGTDGGDPAPGVPTSLRAWCTCPQQRRDRRRCPRSRDRALSRTLSRSLALAISLSCSLSLSIALALSCYLLLFSLALFLSRSLSLYLALALSLSRQLSLSLAISCSILSSCFSLACSLCPLPLARTCALRPSCYVSVPATAVDRNSDSSSGPQP